MKASPQRLPRQAWYQAFSVDALIMPFVLCSALAGLGLPVGKILAVSATAVVLYAIANGVARYFVFAMPKEHNDHHDAQAGGIVPDSGSLRVQPAPVRTASAALGVAAAYLLCGAVVIAPFGLAGRALSGLTISAAITLPVLAALGGLLSAARKTPPLSGALGALVGGAGAAWLVHFVTGLIVRN